MDWGVFMRRPNASAEAERTYSLVATHCQRLLDASTETPEFQPWADVFARASKDSAAVSQVKKYAEALRTTGTAASFPAEGPGSEVAAAIRESYEFVTQVVGLRELPASLAAAWCWLQWIEQT